jgi:hypothetical protein
LAWEKAAREKHVFTLPAIEPPAAVNQKRTISRRLTLARAEAFFEAAPVTIYRGMSVNNQRQALTRERVLPIWCQSISGVWSPLPV